MHYQHADGRYSSLGYYDATPQWEPEQGGQWVEGEPSGSAWQQVSPTQAIKNVVAAMPPAVLLRYSGDASLIGQFLNEGNLTGAGDLLVELHAKIVAANDTEVLTAIAPVLSLLGV